MTGEFLGKITRAEYGRISDMPFLMGLELDFAIGSGGGIGSAGRYTVNMTKDPNRKFTQEEQNAEIVANAEFIYELLNQAKCNSVSELKNKPVIIEIDKNLFKGFRILTEVL